MPGKSLEGESSSVFAVLGNFQRVSRRIRDDIEAHERNSAEGQVE